MLCPLLTASVVPSPRAARGHRLRAAARIAGEHDDASSCKLEDVQAVATADGHELFLFMTNWPARKACAPVLRGVHVAHYLLGFCLVLSQPVRPSSQRKRQQNFSSLGASEVTCACISLSLKNMNVGFVRILSPSLLEALDLTTLPRQLLRASRASDLVCWWDSFCGRRSMLSFFAI